MLLKHCVILESINELMFFRKKMYNMILKYITQCFKIIFNFFFFALSLPIQQFKFISDKKIRDFSSNKLIKLLK